MLCVSGPHAIPVSTAVRAAPDRLLLALGLKRETLSVLRCHPAVAYCLLGDGVAFTAYGYARVLADELSAAPVAAVEVRVESVQDHLADGRTAMLDGARWERTDPKISESDAAIDSELRRLAAQ